MESLNFHSSELQCHDGCGVNKCTQGLLDALEQFRAAVNVFLGTTDTPVLLDSAYRCKVNNARVGGAANSEHLAGEAADVRVKGLDAGELEVIARSCPLIHGIGRNDFGKWLHIDVRPRLAQWCYGGDGKWCTYYAPKTGGTDAHS